MDNLFPSRRSIPSDAAARQRALGLEDYFDEQLGPPCGRQGRGPHGGGDAGGWGRCCSHPSSSTLCA